MERNDHCWCPPTIQPGESWKAIDLISSPLLCAPKNQDSEQTMPTTSNSLWDLQSSSLPKHEPPEVAWTKLCQSFMFFHILRHFKVTKWYTDRAHDPHSSSIGHSCRRKAVHSFGTFSVILGGKQCSPRLNGLKIRGPIGLCLPPTIVCALLLRKRYYIYI